jgi:hypothetical protein
MFWFETPWHRSAIREKRSKFKASSNIRESEKAGPIERAYYTHQGRVVQKWHHYLPLYDRYFSPFKGQPVRFLEIGVSKGGSLQLWRDYFGPDATIFGIDIDPACVHFDGEHGVIRIGSQDDPDFLKSVVSEMGGVDIVLDDGSHVSKHLKTSFETLVPLISEGGIYMAEDLHCCYWSSFGGGYRRPGSFVQFTKTLIDDMHHWYHLRGQKIRSARDLVQAIHIHDSLFVFEKSKVVPPLVSRRGID